MVPEQPDYFAIGAAFAFVCTFLSAAIHSDQIENFRNAFLKWGESKDKRGLVVDAAMAVGAVAVYALLISLPVVLVVSVVAFVLRSFLS